MYRYDCKKSYIIYEVPANNWVNNVEVICRATRKKRIDGHLNNVKLFVRNGKGSDSLTKHFSYISKKLTILKQSTNVIHV